MLCETLVWAVITDLNVSKFECLCTIMTLDICNPVESFLYVPWGSICTPVMYTCGLYVDCIPVDCIPMDCIPSDSVPLEKLC